MNINSVKYVQGITFSHIYLTLAKKTDIKNVSLATPDLVIFESSWSRTQTNVRKYNPAVHAEQSGSAFVLQ